MPNIVQKINPPTLPDAPSMGYSQISVCEPGKLVFISGQVAWQPDGSPVPDDLIDQATIAMGNVIKALEAVEAGPENITSIRMYIVNPALDDFMRVAPALSSYMGETIPTFTALGVTNLGGEGLKIELEATAVV
ncbi:MAG: RidA family protein [Pseudomonadota bacterium]